MGKHIETVIKRGYRLRIDEPDLTVAADAM
jgi:hypothetical protein